MIMYSFNIEMYVTDLVQGKRIVLKLYIKISLHFMTILIRTLYKAFRFCATGLPIKDETSEKTLRNLYCFFIFIPPCH